MDSKFYAKRKKLFLAQSVLWCVFLALVAYYLPELLLFYLLCGFYDVSRNSQLDGKLIYRYFFGNGTLTWALAPFNVLMDVLTLPYVNKKIYRLSDLPADCQRELEDVLNAARTGHIVEGLASRVEPIKRGMIFFKWYGKNLDNFIDVPAFHREYKYVKTIGVSVFNKKESTAEHFGPLRVTLRVLYNINDVTDRAAYIKVRETENHWRDNKLFIFDDTLSHQSLNETDMARYCLFVDIIRPSKCHAVLEFILRMLANILQKSKFIFYGSWVPLK